MIGGGATSLGGFRVSLGLDTDDYARGIINAESMNRVFGESVTAFMANPILGATSILQSAGRAFVSHSSRVLEAAEAHERMAQRLDVSVELLQALEGRAEQAGYGMQIAEQGLKTLNQRLGEAREGMPEAVKVFDQLGIEIGELSNTDEAMAAVLDAMQQLPSVAQRAAVGAKLFGEEAGTKLANTVGGGSDAIRQMIAEQRSLGQVLDGSTVSSLAAFNTTLGKTQQLLAGSRDVLLANFIAGFVDEVEGGNVNVERLGDSIQQRLVPLARELGQELGEVTGKLDDIIDRIDQILAQLETGGALEAIENISSLINALATIADVGNALPSSRIGKYVTQEVFKDLGVIGRSFSQ